MAVPGTVFQRPVNNFKTTLSAQHTSGSGTFVLQAGDGALLGALGTNEVYRITLVTSPGASETIVGVFECTTLTTDTLSGATVVEGFADSTIAINTPVQVRATAKTFSAIHTAINALEVISETSVTAVTTISTALSSMGKYYLCSGTSANYTVTLPTIDSSYDGLTIGFRMSGALTKLVTITGTGVQTIDGTLARVMWANETCVLEARGSKWFKLSGRTNPMVASMRIVGGTPSQAQSVPNSALTKILLNTTDLDNTGLMADTTNSQILVKRSSNYAVMGVASFDSATAPATRFISEPQKNGTLCALAEGYGATGSYASYVATNTVIATSGDAFTLVAYQSSGASQWVAGYAASSACILTLSEIPSW